MSERRLGLTENSSFSCLSAMRALAVSTSLMLRPRRSREIRRFTPATTMAILPLSSWFKLHLQKYQSLPVFQTGQVACPMLWCSRPPASWNNISPAFVTDTSHGGNALQQKSADISAHDGLSSTGYNLSMARGWESKAVEEQQAEARSKPDSAKVRLEPAQAAK